MNDAEPRLEIEEHYIANGDGWRLHLKATRAPQRLQRDRRPLLIVPGYGMNAFIFGYHPGGMSLERYLAEAGIEVWTVNLRRQGPSRAESKSPPPPSMRAYGEIDVPAAIGAVLDRTRTTADRVDAIGASLGGSILYTCLALREDHRLASIVSIGAPLRWVDVHPALRLAFRSTTVAQMLRFSGTQRFARVALPAIARAMPGLLSIYMNTNLVDLSKAEELTKTVDDPHPNVNADISRWIKHGDLVLRGVNVTKAMARVDNPLLLVIANRDGIVPASSVLSAAEVWGGDVEQLHVGDAETWYAHADLFIGDPAPEAVFRPLVSWLHAQG